MPHKDRQRNDSGMTIAGKFTLNDLPPEQPVLIAGPTASGKSALALAIAETGGGVVVNATQVRFMIVGAS